MPNYRYQFFYMLQLLIYSVFWVRRLKQKDHFPLRLFLCIAAMAGSLLLFSQLLGLFQLSRWFRFTLPYFWILVSFGLSLWVCFDAPNQVILLTVLLPSTAQLCGSALGDFIYFAAQGTSRSGILCDIPAILLMCLVCAVLSRKYDRIWLYDRDIYRIINGMSYAIVACIFLLNGFSPNIEDRFIHYIVVGGYRFLMSAFVFTLVFSLLTVGQIRYQRDLTDVLIRKQAQQYALAQDLTELVEIKYHDMKHMHSAGKDLLEEDSQGLGRFECLVNCGNTALNTTLTEKSIACKRNGINFTMMVDGQLLDFMPPVDIYALFGNMLDNAIDCLTQLPEQERHLRLRVSGTGRMVSVICENTCHDHLEFENGLPRTQQLDAQNHGFGTKSIAHICKKYNAQFQMACRDQMFVLKILIPEETKPEESKSEK